MRITPILVAAACLLVYLVTVIYSALSYVDHLGGAMVVMYITGLAVVLLLGVLLEQVIVNQLRPTMGRLLLIEGTVVLLMFFLLVIVIR